MKTKLLKNCRILRNGKLVKANIFIKNKKIAKITQFYPQADSVYDLKGNIVLPGIIDPHVHFREPGLTHKEDFLTGGIAAAMGGITTVMDMPNTKPPTITVKELEHKRNLSNKCAVNCYLHFGAAKNNLNQIKKAKNIASVKVFMDITTGNMKVDDKTLFNVLKYAPITTVHAEDEKVLTAISLAKKAKAKLYLCHISNETEINIIRYNKDKNIFVEVTPHHLFMHDKAKHKHATMKPALRTKKDQDALWQAIDEGLIDTIGTDHAPHLIEEKAKGAYGVPGLETLVPLLLDAVNKKKLSLQKLVELTSKNPAKIFRLGKKGKVAVGYDADLTVVDLNLKQKVHIDNLFTKCKWSPWEGKTLKGWPIMTIVAGRVMYSTGNITKLKTHK